MRNTTRTFVNGKQRVIKCSREIRLNEEVRGMRGRLEMADVLRKYRLILEGKEVVARRQ